MQNIGVIGLGIMGGAMARNLMQAGYQVTAYNRTAAKAAALAAAGARTAATPAEAAKDGALICIVVTNPQAVWEVLRGDHGVLAVEGQGRAILQHSTLDISSTLEIAAACRERGYAFLDCPVTGSKRQAEGAELIFEAGGDAALLERVHPVLMAMGRHIVHAGPVGAGTALKLCMNMVVAQMTTGLCEAVGFARAMHVDPKGIFDVLEHSPVLNAGYFALKKQPLLSGDYPPAFSLANMLKDVRFMNGEAARKGLSLPATAGVQALLEQALARGLGDQDLTAAVEVLK